jgi:hypothetical protein
LAPIGIEKQFSKIKEETENIHNELNRNRQALLWIEERLTPLDNTSYREFMANIIYAFEPKSEINIDSWIQGPDGAKNIDVEVRSAVDGICKLMVIEVVDLPRGQKARVEIIDALDSMRTDI